MVNRLTRVLNCFVLVAFLISGCREVTPTSIQVPNTEEPQPTATTAPSPTNCSEGGENVSKEECVESPMLYVPQGLSVTIDGVFSEGEWAGARIIELSTGELFLMHDGGYLYVGIRSENLGLGSICVYWEDVISILHSSAALGTAEYERTDQGWQKTRDFTWTNRETTNSQQAVDNRAEHLDKEKWLASNGRMGNYNEMEYQIAMTNDKLRLAVTYLLSPNYESTDAWPDTLGSGCRNFEPLPGDPPETVSFSPDTWITVFASQE